VNGAGVLELRRILREERVLRQSVAEGAFPWALFQTFSKRPGTVGARYHHREEAGTVRGPQSIRQRQVSHPLRAVLHSGAA